MPRLPLDEIDLLIIDQIGKEISGTGMDTNIIGRDISGYFATLRPDNSVTRGSSVFSSATLRLRQMEMELALAWQISQPVAR